MSPETNDLIAVHWRRIEDWIARNVPPWVGAEAGEPLFHGPAPERAIDDLERHLGALPDMLRALLRICDGCRPGDYPLPARATQPTKWRTLSTAEIAAAWDRLGETARAYPFPGTVRTVGPVRASWWDAGWIPVADCGMGDMICVDSNPAPGGAIGQLIQYEHDFEERKVVYPDLAQWLHECANDLESGRYVYVAGVGLRDRQDGE